MNRKIPAQAWVRIESVVLPSEEKAPNGRKIPGNVLFFCGSKGLRGGYRRYKRELRGCRGFSGQCERFEVHYRQVYDSSWVGQPEILEKGRKCEAYGVEVLQLMVGPKLFTYFSEPRRRSDFSALPFILPSV